LPDTSPTLHAVDFTPDSQHILVSCRDNKLRLYDVKTEKLVRTFDAEDTVPSEMVAISPDGRLAASFAQLGKQEWAVRLWDVQSGKSLRLLRGHTSALSGVRFSPDGKRLFSADVSHGLRVWNVADGRELQSIKLPAVVRHGFHISRDGKRLLFTTDVSVRLWDLEAGRELLQRQVAKKSYVYQVIFCGKDRYALYSTDAPEQTGKPGLKACDIILLDLETGNVVHRFTGHKGTVRGLACSPDDRCFYSSSWDLTLRVWDLTSVLPAARPK
jgi:WD40 repeat protein